MKTLYNRDEVEVTPLGPPSKEIRYMKIEYLNDKINNMKKCIECDGLGYHYNQATFQSEHCPQCDGKGTIQEQISHDLGGPTLVVPSEPIGINTTTSVYNDEPTVAAAPVDEPVVTPKPKKTKAPVVEAPVEPEVDVNSGGDVDGSK